MTTTDRAKFEAQLLHIMGEHDIVVSKSGFDAIVAIASQQAAGEPAAETSAPELCRDQDGGVSIDYHNVAGMLSMSIADNGSLAWAVLMADGSKSHGVAQLDHHCFAVLDRALRDAEAAPPRLPTRRRVI